MTTDSAVASARPIDCVPIQVQAIDQAGVIARIIATKNGIRMSFDVKVERQVAAQTQKLLYPDSSFPSDDQRRRRRVSVLTKVRLLNLVVH